jgi:hypothetical protein
MLSFDQPKLATGGNGNGSLPPTRLPFATPQSGAPKPSARADDVAEQPIAARPATPSSVALKAKRLNKLAKRLPRARMSAELKAFRLELATWQAAQPGYDANSMAQREHESNIRNAFRAKHGRV